jgi:hypothetical protein
MPTKNPRITVTLEPQVYDTLTRLSDLQGTSMSAIVSEFLGITMPAMQRMLVAFQYAKDAPQAAREGLRQAIDKAEARMLPAAMARIEQHDMFLREEMAQMGLPPMPLPPVSARGGAERRRVAEPAGDPRPVTRGSGRLKKAHTAAKRRSA